MIQINCSSFLIFVIGVVSAAFFVPQRAQKKLSPLICNPHEVQNTITRSIQGCLYFKVTSRNSHINIFGYLNPNLDI